MDIVNTDESSIADGSKQVNETMKNYGEAEVSRPEKPREEQWTQTDIQETANNETLTEIDENQRDQQMSSGLSEKETVDVFDEKTTTTENPTNPIQGNKKEPDDNSELSGEEETYLKDVFIGT